MTRLYIAGEQFVPVFAEDIFSEPRFAGAVLAV